MDQLPVIWSATQCGFAGWQEMWGDPWLIGSIMVLAYAVTALLLLQRSKLLKGRERAVWTICGLIFLFQAVNTPFDLHSLIWTTGKCLAKAQGWYENRNQVQVFALSALMGMTALILLICIYLFRRNIWGNLLLLIGVIIAVGITGLEVISLHSLIDFYDRALGPFLVGDWIELGGIALVLLAVLFRSRKLRRPQNSTD